MIPTIILVFVVIHSCVGANFVDESKKYIFPGNLDSQRAPAPTSPPRESIVREFRQRVNRKVESLRRADDKGRIVGDIKDIGKQLNDECDELYPDNGNDNDKCRRAAKDKSKRGRKVAAQRASHLADLEDDAKDKAKDLRKAREDDSKPIIAAFEKEIRDRIGKSSSFDKLTENELSDRIELLKALKILAVARCKAVVIGGISPQCSGEIQALTAEVMPDLLAEYRRAKRKNKNKNKDD